MKNAAKSQQKASLSLLYNIFFKLLFFAINSIIFIGEISEKVVSFPPKLLFKLIKSCFRLFYLVIKKVSKFKINFPRIKKPIPIKVKIPRLRIIAVKLRYFILGSLITLLALFIYQSYLLVKSLPSPTNIGKINYALSTHIYDRNGKLLYEIYRDQNRTPIKISDLPAYVTQATIAVEDRDFYSHNGISFFGGIVRAIKENVLKGDLQGGSTITQQLVKSALLTPERTIIRKVKEIILALWTEKLFTKDQILGMYLNQVAYGGSSYGIEEAAKTYYKKYAKDLTLSEAALLAGLPQAPTLYSPFVNPKLALTRRNEVLNLMKDLKFISREQMLESQSQELNIVTPYTKIAAPHFVFYTKSQLENIYSIRQVEEGGLKVTTTLDLDIQEEAEKILREELEKITNLNVTNGAILVTRPATGEILAMVGSIDYFTLPSGAFNVTTALRQPGSSIKPLMYSLALERGYTAATIIDDSPIVFNISGSQPYVPINYDGRFHGRIPLRIALASSFNVPAVKVLNTLGVDSFVNQAKKMGITTWDDSSRFGLSLTLGGGEVKMIDMATAYGVLANQGNKVQTNYIIKLETLNGETLNQLQTSSTKVVNEGVAFILSNILSDNFARTLAFGQRSMLEIPGYKIAVKTGTTDSKKDNWTIGYNPDFLVAVWVGNNDNTPMNPVLTSGITGAAPIWNRVMSFLVKRYGNANSWFKKPENVVEKTCYFGRTEYFLNGTEKSASCSESLFGTTLTPTPNP